MTEQSKRLAVLLGQAVVVFAIEQMMSSRADHQDADEAVVATRRRRRVLAHAIVSETLSFMIDEIITQRRRAEVAIDRAAAAVTMPTAQSPVTPRLPRQPSGASGTSRPIEA